MEQIGKQWHPKTITKLPKTLLKSLKNELKKEFPRTERLRWYSVPISAFSKKDLERIMIHVTEHLRKNTSYEGILYVLSRLGLHGTELPIKKKEKGVER